MIFGTDGVRGLIDKEINSQLSLNIGKGLAVTMLNMKVNKKVLIGKDTRVSSDTYLSAIASSLCDYGIDVVIVGIVSTPVISFLVSHMDFGAGIMITASHNDKNYNGIKIFNEVGEKINKEYECQIENNIVRYRTKMRKKGKIEYNSNLINNYIDYILNEFNCDLKNLTIAIDCANGANYKIAPEIYRKLGANVIEVACTNNGEFINKKCGANYIKNLVYEVKSHNADFGIAFDGDGDRLRIVLSDGRELLGDDILLFLALQLKLKNELNKLTIVGTIMTNMGIEKTYKNYGIKMLRSDVGDKNVISLIKDNDLSIGGEPSGHICYYKHNPTCDALLNSIFLIKTFIENNISIYDVLESKILYPSVLVNIVVDKYIRQGFDSNIKLQNEIRAICNSYPDAKILVRPSGTEPMIRVYVESELEANNEKIANILINIIKNTK